MSRQQRPTRAILARSVDQRLAAIIHRLGGENAASDSSYRLPNPPRDPCAGQLGMFDMASPGGWWPPENESG
jgi:hypothetical protein